jgi:hypothetical protein
VERKAKDKVRDDLMAFLWRRHILCDQYRLVVGRVGIVYDGKSKSEARRRFRLFIIQSRTAGSRYAGEPVTLFKNYVVIKEYNPPDRE